MGEGRSPPEDLSAIQLGLFLHKSYKPPPTLLSTVRILGRIEFGEIWQYFIFFVHASKKENAELVACMFFSPPEPTTRIEGGPVMFVNEGSMVNLSCIVRHTEKPPRKVK